MTSYGQLAIVYLKNNRKRCLVTVAGVALCVVLLFVVMNLGVSYVVTQREAQRAKTDYEAVFSCSDRATAERVAAEEDLRTARLEEREDPGGGASRYVVYVNFKQPYRMARHAEEIAERHGITFELSKLAAFYLQDGENDWVLTVLLTVLLVAFFFAILGVGTIRNSIQLITLEQVKDYGILRCIGATRRQLMGCIYLMGLYLELAGIILGTVFGFLVYLVPARVYHLRVGFHGIVLPFILAAFLGDLYFVMQENCRFLNGLTPAAAVSGGFQIKLKPEKIKAGRGRLMGKLLGFEGSYAYKSLMRTPARFWKTTGSVGFGIAMVVVAFATNRCVSAYVSGVAKHYGHYQVYGYHTGSVFGGDREAVRAAWETMARLEESPCVTESKPLFATALYAADFAEFPERFTEKYATDALTGAARVRQLSNVRGGGASELTAAYVAEIPLFGYDEEDFGRLQGDLVEGTLNVSDQGLILVNHSYTASAETDLNGNINKDYEVFRYQVGDRVTFVDPRKVNELLRELEDRAAKGEFTTVVQDPVTGGNREETDWLQRARAFYEGYQELLEQGETKTYTIEGILRKDSVLSEIDGHAHFVLPREQYFRCTGTGEEQIAGRMYHVKGTRLDQTLTGLCNAALKEEQLAWNPYYILMIREIDRLRSVILGAVSFALFVVGMNVLNILNASAAGLHLRRREFAQLRVLGMSKRRLQKTVLLEGVITGLAASVVGLVLGAGITGLAVYLLNLLVYVEFEFPWGAYGIAAATSIVLLCGSVFLNLRGLKMGMAEELSAN